MQWNGNECGQNWGDENDKTITSVQITIEQKTVEEWGIFNLLGSMIKDLHEVKSRVDVLINEESLNIVKDDRNILGRTEGEMLNGLVTFCVRTAG